MIDQKPSPPISLTVWCTLIPHSKWIFLKICLSDDTDVSSWNWRNINSIHIVICLVHFGKFQIARTWSQSFPSNSVRNYETNLPHFGVCWNFQLFRAVIKLNVSHVTIWKQSSNNFIRSVNLNWNNFDFSFYSILFICQSYMCLLTKFILCKKRSRKSVQRVQTDGQVNVRWKVGKFHNEPNWMDVMISWSTERKKNKNKKKRFKQWSES